MKFSSTALVVGTLAVLPMLPMLPASAASLFTGLGAASGYSLVSLGSDAEFNINSGPLTGDILVGQGTKLSSSGGGGGVITGRVDYDNTTNIDGLNSLNTAPSPSQLNPVPTTQTSQALTDARALAAYAASLTSPGDSLGKVDGINFAATGAVTAFLVDEAKGALTFTGTAGQKIVVNVANKLSSNNPWSLLGGIRSEDLLINYLGTGNVFSTSGGGAQFGTHLAAIGNGNQNFQFSNLNLAGALVNTEGKIQFVSGSQITASEPFTPIPTPALLPGLVGMGVAALRKRKAEEGELSEAKVLERV